MQSKVCIIKRKQVGVISDYSFFPVSIPYQKIGKALREEQNAVLANPYQNDYQDFHKTALRRSWSAPPTHQKHRLCYHYQQP